MRSEGLVGEQGEVVLHLFETKLALPDGLLWHKQGCKARLAWSEMTKRQDTELTVKKYESSMSLLTCIFSCMASKIRQELKEKKERKNKKKRENKFSPNKSIISN